VNKFFIDNYKDI